MLGDPGRFDLEIDGEGAYDESMQDAVNGDSIAINVPNGSASTGEAGGHRRRASSDYDRVYELRQRRAGQRRPARQRHAARRSPASTSAPATSGSARSRTRASAATSRSSSTSSRSTASSATRAGSTCTSTVRAPTTRPRTRPATATPSSAPSRTARSTSPRRADGETSLSDYTERYSCVNVAEGSADAPVSGEGTSLSGLDVTSGDKWDVHVHEHA